MYVSKSYGKKNGVMAILILISVVFPTDLEDIMGMGKRGGGVSSSLLTNVKHLAGEKRFAIQIVTYLLHVNTVRLYQSFIFWNVKLLQFLF